MSELWSSIEGSIYGNPELSKQSRLIAMKQMMLIDAVDPAGEFALNKKSGDKVGFRLTGRISDTSETPLGESQKIPFGKPPIYHGTGQVFRYGFAIPWTGQRADLDRLDVENTNIRTLREHAARTINKLIYDVLVAGRSFTYVAKTSSTYAWKDDGSVADAAVADFSLFHLRKMKLMAKKRNIPTADGKNHFLYGSPRMEDGLLNDTGANGFVDVSKYASGGAEGILAGEIGKIAGTRIVIDNDVLPDDIGTGSVYGSGFMLGEEAAKEMMVYPVHFRANMNLGGDFGNQQALAWQCMLGYKSIWNYTSHGQGSIVHYTSS